MPNDPASSVAPTADAAFTPPVRPPASDGYRADAELLGRPLARPAWEPRPGAVARCVIDTDAAAEVDDQFAIAYALVSPDRVRVEAITAAPFIKPRKGIDAHNGMDLSYDEVLATLDAVGLAPVHGVARGATRWMRDAGGPVASDATDLIIDLAKSSTPDDPLYLLGIAAPTNLSSALLLAPEIAATVVVVWLGGHPTHYATAREYNLRHDLAASVSLFDGAAPLLHVPGKGVSELLRVTVPEVDAYVGPHGRIGAFLAQRTRDYHPHHVGWSKILWDVANVAYLVNPGWMPCVDRRSVRLRQDMTWDLDGPDRPVVEAVDLFRDRILRDLYTRLADHARGGVPAGASETRALHRANGSATPRPATRPDRVPAHA